MAGFIIHKCNKKSTIADFHWLETQLHSIDETDIQDEYDKIHYQHIYRNDFQQERLNVCNENYLLIGKGLVSNLSQLPENHYQEKQFFKNYKGHFCGLLYDKTNQELIVFNNQSGTQKVFYFQNDEHLLVSTDLYPLIMSLHQLSVKIEINENAAYLLTSSGYMHEDFTLFNEIKQIRAGEFLSYKNNELKVESYFNLKQIMPIEISYSDAIEQLDEKFRKAVDLEFSLDKKYGYKSYTTLSGGLDSRMVALIAYESGYKDQVIVNFSKPKYADEVIAKRIAKDYNLEFIQIPLGPEVMLNLEKVVEINGGQTIYTGAAHVYRAMAQLKDKNSGIIHTGNIGDAVLGSFISSVTITKPNIDNGLYSKASQQAISILKESASKYETEELYKFYNRAFSGANNGFLYYDLAGESSSPFLEPEFLSFAFSLPREYKLDSKIYIDWIKQKHPVIAEYIWEAIGSKPTNDKMLRFIYRLKRAVVKRLPLQTMWKNNMNPEQEWFEKDNDLNFFINDYFNQNIGILNQYPILQRDLKKKFSERDINSKAQVVTLLASLNLYKFEK